LWWQVLGSNQRRLSRRFYRPLANTPSPALVPLLLPTSARIWRRYLAKRMAHALLKCCHRAGIYGCGFLSSSANWRQAAVLNRSTGPVRSVVSRTAIPPGPRPTSTQPPPLAPLWLDFRHCRASPCVPISLPPLL